MSEKDDKFSLTALLEMFWEMAKGQLANIPNTIMSSLNGFLGGWFGPILKHFGWDEKVTEITGKIGEVGNQLTSSFDKDLGTARTETAKAAEHFIATNKATLLVEEKNLKPIKDLTQQYIIQFLATGIPQPDSNGVPIAAYTAALNLRNALVLQLAGDNANDNGTLPVALENRVAEAERIATLITGVPKGADLSTLAKTPPQTGLVSILSKTQTTRHAEAFKEGDLKNIDYAIKADSASLLAIGSHSNPNIKDPKNAKETTPPTAPKNKDNKIAK